MLLEYEKLNSEQSALLAEFGASHSALKMGAFGTRTVSYEELIDIATDFDEVIVYNGEIEFHEDDEVSLRDFEEDFEILENVLELPRVTNNPKWLQLVNGDQTSRQTWSFDSALETALTTAWGHVEWNKDNVTVGYVNGTEISRDCRVATRVVVDGY